MENVNQQIAARIKEANNVLITVSNNPTVDQLAAAIGFALILNKLNKHATAVFSGKIPSTLEFLQPEKTLEKNTDSLRDFIIALDKSKADKLRYKVEDDHVKIFITPYRTSISQNDLQFSQGDFNVDVVVALGVHDQSELDGAITAHGRILHDAAVISINNQPGADLGSLNLVNEKASSLCEIVASLSELIHENPFDGQMATALLTGIVAETERFSNQKTSSDTMGISAKLMAAGANQQLVAERLAPPPPEPVQAPEPAQAPFVPPMDQLDQLAAQPEEPTMPVATAEAPQPEQPQPELPPVPAPNQEGALLIDHNAEEEEETPPEPEEEKLNQIHIDENGQFMPMADMPAPVEAQPVAAPAPEPAPQPEQTDQPQQENIPAPDSMAPPAPQDPVGMSLPSVGNNVFAPQQPPMIDGKPLIFPQPEQPQQPVDTTSQFAAPPMPPMPPMPAAPYAPAPDPLPSQPMEATDQTDDLTQPEPQVISPQRSFLDESQSAVMQAIDGQNGGDGQADHLEPSHMDAAVQGHKVINPLPDTMPKLNIAGEPGNGDSPLPQVQLPPVIVDAAPAVPPPMMPPLPGMPVSGQPISAAPGSTINPNDTSQAL